MGNRPVNFNDPSGHCAIDEGPEDCKTAGKIFLNEKKWSKASKIEKAFHHVTVKNAEEWTLSQLDGLYSALFDINKLFGNSDDNFEKAFGDVIFTPVAYGTIKDDGVADANWNSGVIRVTPYATLGNFVHEMGHIFDGHDHQFRGEQGYLKSQLFVSSFNSGNCEVSPCYKDEGWSPTGQTTPYAKKSSLEDFADAFAAVLGQPYRVGPERRKIINLWISFYDGSSDPFQ